MFRQFGGQNCRTSKSLTSQFAFLEFSKGTYRNFKQIANQDGLSVHSNPSFSHKPSKVHAKTKIILQFRLGEYAASRQHGGSRAFPVEGWRSTVKYKGVPQIWTQFGKIWLKRRSNPCLVRVCAGCHKCGQKSEMWHPFEG